MQLLDCFSIKQAVSFIYLWDDSYDAVGFLDIHCKISQKSFIGWP